VGSGGGAVLFFVACKRFSTFAELKGARLGVLSKGSCSDWYMRELLRHKEPEVEVSIVGLGRRYPRVLAMLAEGDLDGAIISEPHVSMGEEAGWFNVWLGLNRCDFVPRMQWTIMVANNDLLQREPDLVRGVISGSRRSYRYAAEHRAEWADFGARYFGIPCSTMMKSIDRELPDLHFDCEIDIEGLAAAVALQQRLGSVAPSLRVTDIIDPRFSAAQPVLAS
jgi:ABC-type nitrate/sulfonate/bicarbonate transport system substrate-binding protein